MLVTINKYIQYTFPCITAPIVSPILWHSCIQSDTFLGLYAWTGRGDPTNLSTAQPGRYLTFDPAGVTGCSAALCATEYQTAGSTP